MVSLKVRQPTIIKMDLPTVATNIVDSDLRELEATPTLEQQIFTPTEYDGYWKVTVDAYPLSLEDLETTATLEDQVWVADEEYDGLGTVTVHGYPLALQEKTVTATLETQTVVMDEDYDGLSSVTVNGYPLSLQEKNITASLDDQTVTADDGYDGLSSVGVAAYPLALQDIEVAPSTESQLISVEEGYDGINSVSVSAVTSGIDENIVAENIKRGVEILGVEGTGVFGNLEEATEGVNFRDYDGTIVETWAASEVAEKAALPNEIVHDGLTSTGWNWTLEEIQSTFEQYPDCCLDVGQTYEPIDGALTINIELNGRLSPFLGLGIASQATIIWGDGSEPSTLTGSSLNTTYYATHTYADNGNYSIKVISDDYISIRGGTLGSHLLTMSSSSYKDMAYRSAIKSVIVPSNCYIGDYAFYNCLQLNQVIINSSNGGSYSFRNTNIKYITLPRNYNSLDKAFLEGSIERISYNTINQGGSAFYNNNVKKVNSLPTYNNYFARESIALLSCNIFNNVTSIYSYCFYNCYSLQSITIPSSVTSILANAFANCYSLSYIKFLGETPPTLANNTVFTNLPTDCKIYIPEGALAAYTSASYYPSSSTYTYIEY